MKFSRSRQLRYRCCDLLLCSAPLLMVYNATPWYHTCSNSTTLDHYTSMETSQHHFMIVPRPFLGNVLDQDTDQHGNEHRSGTTANGCSKLVERCRYVAGGMEFDLAPLPSTTDVIFVYNTPLFKNYILKGFC